MYNVFIGRPEFGRPNLTSHLNADVNQEFQRFPRSPRFPKILKINLFILIDREIGMISGFKDKTPRICEDCFIADSAVVIGDVEVGDCSSVWFNAVVRGDMDEIKIGCKTNVQDCAVVHSDPGIKVDIGDGVTIGHGSVVHGCKIEDNVIIGMNATVLNGAEIGKNSIVAANALIPPEKMFPQNSVIMGVPGVRKKECAQSDIQLIQRSAEEYVKLAAGYRKSSE